MRRGTVVALSGGVGGAKLALGLSRVLLPDELLVIANTGDDFEHLGLSISPDIDTLTYVLAGLDNTVQGWGWVKDPPGIEHPTRYHLRLNFPATHTFENSVPMDARVRRLGLYGA